MMLICYATDIVGMIEVTHSCKSNAALHMKKNNDMTSRT